MCAENHKSLSQRKWQERLCQPGAPATLLARVPGTWHVPSCSTRIARRGCRSSSPSNGIHHSRSRASASRPSGRAGSSSYRRSRKRNMSLKGRTPDEHTLQRRGIHRPGTGGDESGIFGERYRTQRSPEFLANVTGHSNRRPAPGCRPRCATWPRPCCQRNLPHGPCGATPCPRRTRRWLRRAARRAQAYFLAFPALVAGPAGPAPAPVVL